MNKNIEGLEYTVPWLNGRVHYTVFGNHGSVFVAFHGFGQRGEVFRELAAALPDSIIIAPDLPFHGNSSMPKMYGPIAPEQVVEFMKKILDGRHIERFSIVAYSIGARFVWPVVKEFACHIDQLILIAPDGIPANHWYKAATCCYPMRLIFKYVMNLKVPFRQLINFAVALKILDKSTGLLVRKTTMTQEKRMKIYHTWIALSQLVADKKMLAQVIDKHKIKCEVVLGESDTVIRPDKVERALRGVGVKIVRLTSDHHQLIERYIAWKYKTERGYVH